MQYMPQAQNSSPFLALLFGAPHAGEVAMHNDLVAMYDALRLRGISPESILSIEGRLKRSLLTEVLDMVSKEVAEWKAGEIFIAVSGHGFFAGEQGDTALVGLELRSAEQITNEYHVFWDELFAMLALPSTINLTLVPDH